jgi:hypothetical protein
MVFVPAANVAKVQSMFTINGEEALNVMYARKVVPSAWTSAEMTDLAEAFNLWWEEEVQPLQHNGTVLLRHRVRDVATANGAQIEVAKGAPNTGAVATAKLPNSIAVAISWRTALTGRSFHGRTYHMGMAESQVDDNDITAAHLVALTAAYADLLTRLGALIVPTDLVVVSYFSKAANANPPHNRAAALVTPIVSAQVGTRVDSQRRRLPRRS